MNELKKTQDPKKALVSAIRAVDIIVGLQIEEKGKYPDPIRWPGEGRKGELWFRNRLLWLRTIPLENDVSFIITHAEAPAYFKGNDKHHRASLSSADLVGIWRSKTQTKLGVAELKAKTNSTGDNVLYAIIEGARNMNLHRKGFERLKEGWQYALKRKNCPKYFQTAWMGNNPFVNKLYKAGAHLIIIGDNSWIKGQERWGKIAEKLIREVRKNLDFAVSVYSLNKSAKPASKPYLLLPIRKWL